MNVVPSAGARITGSGGRLPTVMRTVAVEVIPPLDTVSVAVKLVTELAV